MQKDHLCFVVLFIKKALCFVKYLYAFESDISLIMKLNCRSLFCSFVNKIHSILKESFFICGPIFFLRFVRKKSRNPG